MALDTAQLQLIEQRVANDGPSAGVAFLLWFFTGVVGGHRFYLGRTGSGIAMLLISLTFYGLIITGIWAFVDLFLISGMIRQKRDAIRNALTMQMIVSPTTTAPQPALATPVPQPTIVSN